MATSVVVLGDGAPRESSTPRCVSRHAAVSNVFDQSPNGNHLGQRHGLVNGALSRSWVCSARSLAHPSALLLLAPACPQRLSTPSPSAAGPSPCMACGERAATLHRFIRASLTPARPPLPSCPAPSCGLPSTPAPSCGLSPQV